jgi:hypothetical protein
MLEVYEDLDYLTEVLGREPFNQRRADFRREKVVQCLDEG